MNLNEHLAVDILGRAHKHCRDCTLLMAADESMLKQHYEAHHQGRHARFLRWNEGIIKTVYSNFHDYLYGYTDML